MSFLCVKWRTVQPVQRPGSVRGCWNIKVGWANNRLFSFNVPSKCTYLSHYTKCWFKMHEVNNSKMNIVCTFDNKIPKSILEGRTSGGRTFAGGPRSGWETKWRRMPPDGSRRKTDTQQQGIGVAVGRKQGWPWPGSGPNGHGKKKKKKKVKVCKSKISVSIWRRKSFIAKSAWLMLFREVTAEYLGKRTKIKHIVWTKFWVFNETRD